MEKLKAIPEAYGTLLDSVTALYGGGISNGFEHTHTNLPILVVGGAARRKVGRHLRFSDILPWPIYI